MNKIILILVLSIVIGNLTFAQNYSEDSTIQSFFTKYKIKSYIQKIKYPAGYKDTNYYCEFDINGNNIFSKYSSRGDNCIAERLYTKLDNFGRKKEILTINEDSLSSSQLIFEYSDKVSSEPYKSFFFVDGVAEDTMKYETNDTYIRDKLLYDNHRFYLILNRETDQNFYSNSNFEKIIDIYNTLGKLIYKFVFNIRERQLSITEIYSDDSYIWEYTFCYWKESELNSEPNLQNVYLITDRVANQQVYDYSTHSNFDNFWTDFRSAVLSENKEEVIKMIKIPFEDRFQDIYDKAYGNSRSLTSKTKEELMKNFDRLFAICSRKSISNAIFKKLNESEYENFDTNGPGLYKLSDDSYMLEVECFSPRLLIFEKIKGEFKLSYIPYQE